MKNLNYTDFLILLAFIYFIFEGVKHGFWVVLANFIAFTGSLLVSLRYYYFTAVLVHNYFSFPGSISNALGFLLTAVFIEMVLGWVMSVLIFRIPKKYLKSNLSKILSVLPALGEAVIVISFILVLVISSPFPSEFKEDISSSELGGRLITNTQKFETKLRDVLGAAVEDSLTYLIIHPDSEKRVALLAYPTKMEVDEEAELRMLSLVNEERGRRGVGELVLLPDAVPVARSYARKMWEERYFGHVSPEEEDVSDRLRKAGIDYFIVGENLALAPTLETAHTGLMGSEGHRKNILNPDFEKIAIGVVDNGIYGKIFVQIFIK